MNIYPQLSNLDAGLCRELRVVASNIQENANYLEENDCPYSPEVILHLQSLFQLTAIQPESEGDAVAYENFDPIEECVATLRDLQKLKTETKSLSTNEKIQTYKLIATHLEKLTETKKELERVEDYRQFKECLFDILERHLTPAQIGEFMADLEDATRTNQKAQL